MGLGHAQQRADGGGHAAAALRARAAARRRNAARLPRRVCGVAPPRRSARDVERRHVRAAGDAPP
eukprot:740549-Prymnesium_polylepis.1